MTINWSDAATADTQEAAGFEDFPNNAWCIGATAVVADGGSAPKCELQTPRGGADFDPYYRFAVGLKAKGGDASLTDKYKDRYMFFQCGVHPSPDELKGGKRLLMSGRLTGFLNALYSRGVGLEIKDAAERAKVRWSNTLNKLQEISKSHPEISEQSAMNDLTGTGDLALCLVQLAIAGLENDSQLVLFKIKNKTSKTSGDVRQQISQYEDFVDAHVANRKVRLFEAEGVVVPAGTKVAF